MGAYNRPVGTLYLLKRAELAVRSCIEVALAEFDLTPAQFLMLFRMRDCAQVSAADLARDIGVRPQSLINLIAALERAGVLEREPSPRHRRILHMRLTGAGRRLVAEAMRTAARIERELLAGVDAERLAGLQEALTALRERAEAHDLHPGSIRARAEEAMRSGSGSGRRGPSGSRRGPDSRAAIGTRRGQRRASRAARPPAT